MTQTNLSLFFICRSTYNNNKKQITVQTRKTSNKGHATLLYPKRSYSSKILSVASTMSSFHSTSLRFARASSLQCTAHLIFILASVSSQGWQTPRGAASKVSISAIVVSSSPCLSSSSFDLTSCWARSSSHCWTSSGVSGLSVVIVYRWHLRWWGTVLLSGNGVARWLR